MVQRVRRRGAGATLPPAATKIGEPAEDPRNETGKGREENEASKQKKKEKSKTVTKDEWQEDSSGKTSRDLGKPELKDYKKKKRPRPRNPSEFE